MSYIHIPSKKTYNISNPKIRDNVIDSVNIEETIVSPDNQYNVSVYNEQKSIYTEYLATPQENLVARARQSFGSNVEGTKDTIGAKIAYVSCTDKYMSSFTIKVPILQVNKYVSNLILGKNKETDTYNIGIQLYGYINSYTASTTWTCYGKNEQIGGDTEPVVDSSAPINFTTIQDNSNSPTTTITLPTEWSVSTSNSSLPSNFDASISINDVGNLATATADRTTEDGIDYFVLNLNIMHSFKLTYLSGYGYNSNGKNVDVPLQGYRDTYNATHLEITIKGDTIGISTNNVTNTYGEGNKKITINGNELIQGENTVVKRELAGGAFIERLPLGSVLSEAVRNNYAIGKETCELTCSISDYYDEEGKKVVSISDNDRMTFLEGDVVVPMIRNSQGVDIPMSRNKDGSAKKFTVYGVDVFYDGAVWQKLSLQETGVENG